MNIKNSIIFIGISLSLSSFRLKAAEDPSALNLDELVLEDLEDTPISPCKSSHCIKPKKHVWFHPDVQVRSISPNPEEIEDNYRYDRQFHEAEEQRKKARREARKNLLPSNQNDQREPEPVIATPSKNVPPPKLELKISEPLKQKSLNQVSAIKFLEKNILDFSWMSNLNYKGNSGNPRQH